SVSPIRSVSQAWWEKNRHTAWNDTAAAIPAPASMPTTVRRVVCVIARWPAGRTTRTCATGETRAGTHPAEHATTRVGSGTEASADLPHGVELSLNRRCFAMLTARSRRHADYVTRITDATQVKLRNSRSENQRELPSTVGSHEGRNRLRRNTLTTIRDNLRESSAAKAGVAGSNPAGGAHIFAAQRRFLPPCHVGRLIRA